ncbi:NitT/TauT family transport system substrate-binding protein [Paenibacillus sp. UNCCL117]|uniref:ABC transporter substrate-binding protein n=1 Tax=unclassified Paenibacillus TaxID=185978 RepID=UPI000884B3C6|nr:MULTISPECIES: ABC transporter substrate-binding protein [unclassified Paenibacillus]SDC45305.1 NitT/TauT family transport system substrate-binding protein [Paenibacillus sp. cl123]SFW12536.1 NitT/TauT family transport system substrate-binding protein [Paenibacillus sp. UNCCL117]
MSKRFGRKRALLAVAVSGVLAGMALLAGCGMGPKDGAVKVRIGEVTRSIFYAPQYVAINQGFFKEQGLDVELTTTAGGDKTMTTLLSGGIDVALVGSETSIYVHQQGSDDPVLNFAQLTQTDGTFLVSRKPLQGKFDWNTLKGSTFLGQRKGGMPQMAGEFTLKKYGIDPHKDLNLLQNVDFANIPTAFASGTGDYVQLFEPQATMFEKQGKGHVIASFGVESGKLPYTVFMTKKSYMTKQPDTVQKFANAVQKAQLWVQTSTPEQIADAIMSFFPDTDKEIVIGVVKRYKEQGSFATDGIVDEAEWNNLQDVMEAAGELKQRAEHGKLVDNSFAEKAKSTVKP